MGFGTIGATTILFVGILFILTTSVNAFFEAQREHSSAIQDDRAREEFRRNTAIGLTSGGHDSDTTFYLNVTNTGDTVLDLTRIGLFLDGSWSNAAIDSKTIDGRVTDLWAPGELLRMEVNTASEPARAYFVVETGQGVLWTP